MRAHDESTAHDTRFDTTREVIAGTYVPAESIGHMWPRLAGQTFQPRGRAYVGTRRKQQVTA